MSGMGFPPEPRLMTCTGVLPDRQQPTLQRRQVIQLGGALAALLASGIISPTEARAAVARTGFDSKTLDGALAALGSRPAQSDQVQLNALEVSEDGAVTPFGVISKLQDTTEIHLLVEKNPTPLAVSFHIPPGTLPEVSVRLKLAESSRVTAVVRAQGKLYSASRQTAVVMGSCGG